MSPTSRLFHAALWRKSLVKPAVTGAARDDGVDVDNRRVPNSWRSHPLWRIAGSVRYAVVASSGVWRSLVARFVRDEEAVGSNPATPTQKLSIAESPPARPRQRGISPSVCRVHT
jgi:hypothetical protein